MAGRVARPSVTSSDSDGSLEPTRAAARVYGCEAGLAASEVRVDVLSGRPTEGAALCPRVPGPRVKSGRRRLRTGNGGRREEPVFVEIKFAGDSPASTTRTPLGSDPGGHARVGSRCHSRRHFAARPVRKRATR